MNDLTDRFNEQSNQSPETPDQATEQGRGIVTKAELEELKKQLERPEAVLEYAPTGTAVRQFQEEMEQRKRAQFRWMEARLNRMSHKARDDFDLTQMHTHLQETERER